MSVQEATIRYLAARNEFIAAADALRRDVLQDVKAAVVTYDATSKRRTWKEARETGVVVQEFARAHPQLTQVQLGIELGMRRDLLRYYLKGLKHAPAV